MFRSRTMLMLAVAAFTVAACGDDGGNADVPPGGIVSQMASYEPVAGFEQRLLVGLTAPEGKIVAFGEVMFDLAYIGTATTQTEVEIVQSVPASYRLVAGMEEPADTKGPRLFDPFDGGLGVYGATVSLDKAGFWAVRVRGDLTDGTKIETTSNFEVFAEPRNPFIGQLAPRTQTRMVGDAGITPKGIDSRAGDDGVIPDPRLHDRTIADMVDSGEPFVVVISTPTYCISRFCGPITDTVGNLADEYDGKLEAAHLEVWNDFENKALNKEAAEWIYQNGADPREPWVFVVDRNGVIVDRFDNVTTETDLRAAIERVVA